MLQQGLIKFLVFLNIDLFVMTPEEIKLCDGEWSNWQISKYAALGTLCLLTLWELMQLTSKIVNGQFREYFGWQNMIECLMISLTFAFFLVETLEYSGNSHPLKSGAQEHLLGWALFLAWLDFTMFLGRFDIFGRHIYRSFHVMKNVAWSLVVYLPSLMAFALAFHCFLDNDPIFEGPTASILKTVAMLLGEFNYEGRFLYDYVESIDGSQYSVQVLYVLFIVYGSVIVMNLITAWIVVNQRDANSEIILAEQQIEEITGSTEVTNCCRSELEGDNVPLKLSVKPVHNKEGNCCMSLLRSLYRKLMKGLFDAQLLNLNIFWVIKDKEEKHRKLLPYVPLEIIELTIDRLTKKKEKKLKLMESIKEVLEEAKKNMDRYTPEE